MVNLALREDIRAVWVREFVTGFYMPILCGEAVYRAELTQVLRSPIAKVIGHDPVIRVQDKRCKISSLSLKDTVYLGR